MIDHRRARSLAAEAIDFPLDLVARRDLESHLAACTACAADAAGYRHDAERLAGLPAIAPPPRVHAAVFGRRRPSRLPLLVAAVLLVAATIAAAALIGAAIQELREPDLAVVEPSPTDRVTRSLDPTTGPTTPSSLPPTPTPPPGLFRASPASLPLADGNATVAAAPGGGVYVLVDRPRMLLDGPGSQATLALLDGSGIVRPGWPIQLAGWSCSSAEPVVQTWTPVVIGDGSVRLVCTLDDPGAESATRYAFAFDQQAQPLPGWPVGLGAAEISAQPVAVGDDLVVLSGEIAPGAANEPFRGTWTVTAIAADGSTLGGPRTEIVEGFSEHLGPDGVAYVLSFAGFDPVVTRITALDVDGVLEGWPVDISGDASRLVVGSDGNRYLTVTEDVDGTRTQVVVLDPRGRVVSDPDRSDSVASWPFAGGVLAEWTGASPTNPAMPLIPRPGGGYLIGVDREDRVVVHATDRYGGALPGWPFELDTGLQPLGRCTPQDTGCGYLLARPALGPGGSLIVPLAGTGGSGSLLALEPDGSVQPGWPLTLGGGLGFRSLSTAATGVIFAVAAGTGGSAEVVGIDPDGTVRFRLAFVQP